MVDSIDHRCAGYKTPFVGSTMKKTVFITGASSGIGRSTAQYFLERGWNVVATMRNPDQAGNWLKVDHSLALRLDVTDPETIQAAMNEAISRFGAVDVLVNNAGYGAFGPFEASTSEQVERQIATNVTGLMNVSKALLPHFRERRSGVIVNIASIGGRMTFPLYSLYHATKWAVEGFSEALVYELEPFGIRVKIVEPGPIKTDFYDRSQDVMTKPGLTAYDALVARVMPTMQKAGANAPGPEIVARTIYRAATDGRHRLRYAVNSASVLLLRRLMPTGVFMAVIKRLFIK
jgi:NAD(P)-dependent dehydrogenase (short-subunit alcohol dehydrogenase family)